MVEIQPEATAEVVEQPVQRAQFVALAEDGPEVDAVVELRPQDEESCLATNPARDINVLSLLEQTFENEADDELIEESPRRRTPSASLALVLSLAALSVIGLLAGSLLLPTFGICDPDAGVCASLDQLRATIAAWLY